MGHEPHITVDQLAVLVSIVDHGGFNAAARAESRPQAAVSYHIKRLEEQLGMQLFDRSGHRPVLGEAGRAILARAREVLASLDVLKATADELAKGVEGELVLSVDTIYPVKRIAELLGAFEDEFPTVKVTVRSGAYRAPVEDLHAGRADLAIAPMAAADPAVHARHSMTIRFVPVVAPSHRLARADGPVPRTELEHHRRLLITAGMTVPGEPNDGPRVWRLSDGAMRHMLLLEGVGWARVPRSQVAADLKSGRLVELDVQDWIGKTSADLAVMHLVKRGLGPAAKWLFAHLAYEPGDTAKS